MTPLESARLDVVTDENSLEAVHSVLEGFWVVCQRVPDAARVLVDLAVAEIGANIIKYAGGGRPVRMQMDVRCLADKVEVRFCDDGDPFELDLDSLDMPDELAESGRGLPLARSILSLLRYHRDDDGNHWLLVSHPFL